MRRSGPLGRRGRAWTLLRRCLVGALALQLALAPLEVHAQDSGASVEEGEETAPAQRQTTTRRPKPWDMPEEERLRVWEVEKRNRQPGSILAGLFALTVGAVWHGGGHYMVNQQEEVWEESMWLLFITEMVSLGLIGAAITIQQLSNDSDALNPVWNSLLYAGGMLFLSSYLIDVLGAFKGSSRPLFGNQRVLYGITPTGSFRFAPNDPFGFTWLVGIKVPIDYQRVRLQPSFSTLLSDGSYWSAGGDTMLRLWISDDHPGTNVAIGAEARYEAFGDDFNVLMTMPFAEFSFDVGSVLEHLANFQIVNRLGYGFEFFDWVQLDTDDRFFKDVTSLFVLETEMSLNLLESLNMTLSYRRRPDLLIGGLSRYVGIIGTRVQFANDGFLMHVEANFGTLTEIVVALGVNTGG